jgi:amino acid transporter
MVRSTIGTPSSETFLRRALGSSGDPDGHPSAHKRGVTLRRALTTLPLVFVLFFTVSGGAYSTEELVARAGPGLALLMLVLVPLLWSLPEVLIVGELASMLPEEGGYYAWVRRAFGPFWAFQNGWWTWMYSLVDMAIYPVLFTQYLTFFVPHMNATYKWIVSLAIIWGAALINLRGAGRVGGTSIVAGVVVLGAFALLTIAALPHFVHTPWHPFVAPGSGVMKGLGVGLSVALWNYIGWDNASTVQGEVVDASRSYPKALAITLPLVMLSYLLPLIVTLGASDWTHWHEGGWPDIALASAGAWGPVTAQLLAIGGMVSALALFNALLMSYSRIPFAMAIDGLLPPQLACTDVRGTPRTAIIISALCYSVFAIFPFAELVVADVVLYALALFLEFGALIQLRKREPTLRGTFRIPVGRGGVILLALLPVAILLLVIALGLLDGDYAIPALLGALGAVLFGPVGYWFMTRQKTH